MARRKKLSISMLLVEGLGLVVMLKAFVWIIGHNVMKSPFTVPELDYALFGLGMLLVLRVGYVLLKAKVFSKRISAQSGKLNQLSEPLLDEHVCALCGKPVSAKVLSYCKANSQRFQGKIYCYDHQRTVKQSS